MTHKLFIDATNIHAGGGLLHLSKIIQFAQPETHGFEQVVVCASQKTLDAVSEKPWLVKHTHPLLNKGYAGWLLWRRLYFKKLLLRYDKPVLFCAGTLGPPFSYPFYTICQNLLPLEWRELWRYRFSFTSLRLVALRFLHLRAYRNAAGVIFLTHYCHQILPEQVRHKLKRWTVIPHGVDHKVFRRSYVSATASGYIDLLYISAFALYKHHDKVTKAVIELNEEGYAVRLTLVGDWLNNGMKARVQRIKNRSSFAASVQMTGGCSFDELPTIYAEHDVVIFASSCETFGIILTEAMASGKPILCSNRSSMPETLQDAGLYFDPLSVDSIKAAIKQFAQQPHLRNHYAEMSFERSQHFDWKATATKTFQFLQA